MNTVTKFTFDIDFDAPDEPEAVVEEIEEEELEPEIEIPTFSEEELAAARQEGFDEGKEAGRKEAADATEQRLLETVEKACDQLADVYNAQADANHEIAREMITISAAIAKKMFPDLNARNALGEVERVVQETLKAITEEPRVQIMVHPDLRELLTESLATMTHRAGFEGKVFVNPDAPLELGDCRVEWSNGAAIRDAEALWEQIDEIVEQNLHGDDVIEPAEHAESAAIDPDVGPDTEAPAAETEVEPSAAEAQEEPAAKSAELQSPDEIAGESLGGNQEEVSDETSAETAEETQPEEAETAAIEADNSDIADESISETAETEPDSQTVEMPEDGDGGEHLPAEEKIDATESAMFAPGAIVDSAADSNQETPLNQDDNEFAAGDAFGLSKQTDTETAAGDADDLEEETPQATINDPDPVSAETTAAIISAQGDMNSDDDPNPSGN